MTAKRFSQIIAVGTIAATLSAGTALAWSPKGVITKGVTNVSTGSTYVSPADSVSTAVLAKPGDTLKYTIVIKNATNSSKNYDDLGYTKLTDVLPAGVEIVSGKVTDDIGTVPAQKSVTRTITVRVNAGVKNGTILDNKACFTGEATNHEKGTQQSGCDHAIVKIHIPATPTPVPTPVHTPTPTPVPIPVGSGEVLGASTELPQTGTPALASAIGLTAMIGTGAAFLRSRKRK